MLKALRELTLAAGSYTSPNAENTNGAQPQPLPFNPITAAISSGGAFALQISFRKSASKACAISTNENGASSSILGTDSPKARHNPCTVGTQNVAGCTNANNSKTSKL